MAEFAFVTDTSAFALIEDTVTGNPEEPVQYGVIICYRMDEDSPWWVISGASWDTEEERDHNRTMVEWMAVSAAEYHKIPCLRLTPEEVQHA